MRNSFRYVARQHWDALKRDLKPIYTAPTAPAAEAALEHLDDAWGVRYPALIRLWRSCWSEFIPFLDYDTEIRRVLCTTNAIESLNARYRRAIKARGHFPSVLWNQDCQDGADRPLLTAMIGSWVAVGGMPMSRGVVPVGVGASARRCSRWSSAA